MMRIRSYAFDTGTFLPASDDDLDNYCSVLQPLP
jgi:hypothetical protein